MEGVYSKYFLFLELPWVSYFLFGPLLFLYSRSMLGFKTSRRSVVIHLIPAFAVPVFTACVHYFAPQAVSHSLFLATTQLEFQKSDSIVLVLKSLFSLQYMFYLVWALIIIHRYETVVQTIHSNHSISVTKWVKALIYLKLVIFILGIPWYSFVNSKLGLDLYPIVHFTFYFFLLIVLIRQPQILEGIRAEKLQEELMAIEGKYKKLKTSHDLSLIYEQMRKTVIKGRQFTDSGFSAAELAKLLNVKILDIVLALRYSAKMTFAEFIDSCKLEIAKKMLHDKEYSDNSIGFIAFELGYKSISEFEQLFKKATGQAPEQFRNRRA